MPRAFSCRAARFFGVEKRDDEPRRPVVIEENRWAERESNPHSQRLLIYSQRSSPHCSICPRWVRGIQFYRPEGSSGRSAHDAKGARLMTSVSTTGRQLAWRIRALLGRMSAREV